MLRNYTSGFLLRRAHQISSALFMAEEHAERSQIRSLSVFSAQEADGFGSLPKRFIQGQMARPGPQQTECAARRNLTSFGRVKPQSC